MKNNITKAFLLTLIFGSFLTLLSFTPFKGTTINDPGIYLKLNGTQKDFKQYTVATYNVSHNIYSLTLGAAIQDAKGNDIDGVSITLLSNQKDFAAGKTYSTDVSSVNGKNILEIHTDIANNPDHFWVSSPGTSGQEQLTVSITELTDQYVKGTFSGKVFMFPDASSQANVTEGSFYVKFNQ